MKKELTLKEEIKNIWSDFRNLRHTDIEPEPVNWEPTKPEDIKAISICFAIIVVVAFLAIIL